MSRINKYRLWCYELKKFIDQRKFCIDGYGDIFIISESGRLVRAAHNRFSLDAFTGVLDKNNLEIYERDIVDTHSKFDMPYIREIIWRDCGLEFKPLTGFTLCENNTDNFEIVGNIHEHKHLLEAQG